MTIPVSFARPELLWLLLFPLLLAGTALYARRRRASRLRLFGMTDAVAVLSSLPRKTRGRSRVIVVFGLLLMVVAVAGPRWGQGESGVSVGRDVTVVLDLSKSMLADDMRDPEGLDVKERWKAARAGIRGLVATMRQHGGHRIGLVVFAAKPWIVCPLTADYDHFEMRLDEFDPIAPPREVNPAEGEHFPSGTRIGSAIVEAVAANDPRFPGYQDIIMISDGDDPGPDRDSEIETGILAAREAKIPVNVVGVGDPDNFTSVVISSPGREDEPFQTRLFEAPLKEIARQTRGEYYAARREVPDLAGFFKNSIEPRPSRELPDDALPQKRERYLWFVIPAFVLLLLAWLIEP